MDKAKMLAYEFAAQNQLPILQNWTDEKKAGREWMSSFMKRHNLDGQHHLIAILLGSFSETYLTVWTGITLHQKIFI